MRIESGVMKFNIEEIALIPEVYNHPYFKEWSEEEIRDPEVIESFFIHELWYESVKRDGNDFEVVRGW